MEMTRWRVLAPMAALIMAAAVPAAAQVSSATAPQAARFMGTWVATMTNPAGSQQTIRVWEDNGAVAASIQVGRFPSTTATAVVKDGDMLLLSVSHEARPGLRENGQPIWVVIALSLEGDTMHIAQMMEQSETIKRGTGRRQPD